MQKDALLELGFELGERVEAFRNVLAHIAFGLFRSAVYDRIGDFLMSGIRFIDSTRVVERREQQPIDRHAQSIDEHAHVFVARAFDDEPMPFVIESGEALVVARVFDRIQFGLHFRESRFELPRVRCGKVAGGQTFERHASAINLSNLVATERLDRRTAKLFDRHEPFRRQSLQRFADSTATGRDLANDVRFDETLSGNEAAAPNALANPIGGLMHGRHFASRRNFCSLRHGFVAHRFWQVKMAYKRARSMVNFLIDNQPALDRVGSADE